MELVSLAQVRNPNPSPNPKPLSLFKRLGPVGLAVTDILVTETPYGIQTPKPKSFANNHNPNPNPNAGPSWYVSIAL